MYANIKSQKVFNLNEKLINEIMA